MELVDGTYKVGIKLGRGSFGTVYHGIHIVTKQPVAIKIERSNIKHTQIGTESTLYKMLQREVGFPKWHWFGEFKGQKTLVFELLGSNLEQFLRKQCTFSIKTTVMLVQQILTLIERVHHYGYIHRDIKPENLLIGSSPKDSQVYVIDFGLSKLYRSEESKTHIRRRTGKKLVGTARYSSLNTHAGIEQSRRDDLEGIYYVMLYFLKGSLPWQGIRCKTKAEKYERITSLKNKYDIVNLCQDYPSEIARIGTYIRSIKFEQEPNYAYIGQLLQSVSQKASFTFDNVFDWDLPVTQDTDEVNLSKIQKLPFSPRRDLAEIRKSEDSLPKAPRATLVKPPNRLFQNEGAVAVGKPQSKGVKKDGNKKICMLF